MRQAAVRIPHVPFRQATTQGLLIQRISHFFQKVEKTVGGSCNNSQLERGDSSDRYLSPALSFSIYTEHYSA
jgi:hypothetical protein